MSPSNTTVVAPPQTSPQASTERDKATKIGFVSLGCPKNLVDSEVMMGMLASAGAELTRHADDADVILVNTCTFTDSAKQEAENTLLEMAQQKVAAGGAARK